MSYDSTLSIKLYVPAGGKGKFKVNHTTLPHGKFTTHGSDSETEEEIGSVNAKIFQSGDGGHRWVDACNRDTPFPIGTEGSFEIWDYARAVRWVFFLLAPTR
jgi:hypothetical protein